MRSGWRTAGPPRPRRRRLSRGRCCWRRARVGLPGDRTRDQVNWSGFRFVRFLSAGDRTEHCRRVNRAVIVGAIFGYVYDCACSARREVACVEGPIVGHDAMRVTIIVAPHEHSPPGCRIRRKRLCEPLCPAIEIVVGSNENVSSPSRCPSVSKPLPVGAVGLPLEPPQAVKVRATTKAPNPATKLERIVTSFV